jgi:hypothetical protein
MSERLVLITYVLLWAFSSLSVWLVAGDKDRNWAMIGAIALSALAWVAITAAAVGIYRAWP